jgi:uroporphyrinogen-III synthase
VLEEGLRAAGADLTVTVAYRTVMPSNGLGSGLDELRRGAVDWICFTSASTVQHFWAMLPESDRAAVLAGPRVACIGRVTARAAEALGFRVSALPERQDIPGLVEAIVEVARKG